MTNPLDEMLKWLPEVDFAVLEHRFARHCRDTTSELPVTRAERALVAQQFQ